MNGDTIADARLVAGAIAPTPRRLERSEAALRGQPIGDGLAQRAGQLAIAGAKPLRHNGFKIPLLRNLVARAVTASSTDGPIAS